MADIQKQLAEILKILRDEKKEDAKEKKMEMKKHAMKKKMMEMED